MLIYFDTPIWNRLCDEDADVISINTIAKTHGHQIVFSEHNLYEFARCFESKAESTKKVRGPRLFEYAKKMVKGLACIKSQDELIAAEVEAIALQTQVEPLFRGAERYHLLSEVCDRLANGRWDDPEKALVLERQEFKVRTRLGQKAHIVANSLLAQELRAISKERLAAWLHMEAFSVDGIKVFTKHLQRVYPDAPIDELAEYAGALLRSPVGIASRALTVSDLYYNWRYANLNMIPGLEDDRSLPDDLGHVAIASYCAQYLTEDAAQFEYVGMIAGPRINVQIYDRKSVPSAFEWVTDRLEKLPTNA